MIYQLHAVERSFDRYRTGTKRHQGQEGIVHRQIGGATKPNVSRGTRSLPSNRWPLNVDENPKCGIFYVIYREIE